MTARNSVTKGGKVIHESTSTKSQKTVTRTKIELALFDASRTSKYYSEFQGFRS